jgi:hypothetical protein
VRGYSWSGDIGVARLFAEIGADRWGLPNPVVYSAVIQRQHVLAYINESGRNEQEFLLLPRYLSKIKRVERLTTPEGRSPYETKKQMNFQFDVGGIHHAWPRTHLVGAGRLQICHIKRLRVARDILVSELPHCSSRNRILQEYVTAGSGRPPSG